MGSKKQKKSKSVRMLGHDRIEEMYENGAGKKRKKHLDKKAKDVEALQNSIYSNKTAADFHRNWNYYCDAMRDSEFRIDGHKPRTLEEAAAFMPDYLKLLDQKKGRFGREHLSAWTYRAYFAAPAKVCKLSMRDFDLPSRNQRDVRRSRGNWQAKDFNPANHKELIEYQRCVGTRSIKELQKIRGCDLTYIDGHPHIHVHGKGGRERDIPILGSQEEVQRVVDRMNAAGDQRVWTKIPKHYDVHGDRAYYACKAYLGLARPTQELKGKDAYHCRVDKTGITYDRQAMLQVSQYLGHSRESVIAESYLWRLEEVEYDLRH